MQGTEVIPQQVIESKIFIIRDKKVMLDRDLAILYGVTTGNLNKAVKRNINRFPEDFMFQLSTEEYNSLRFQIGILKRGQHSKYSPYAFTENGVAMMSTHKELKQKIDEMEKKYDHQFKIVFDAIKQLIEPANKHGRRIGFMKEKE